MRAKRSGTRLTGHEMGQSVCVMRLRGSVAVFVVLAGAACSSGHGPDATAGTTTTVNRAAIIASLGGLTVKLEVDSREVATGEEVTSHFVVENPTRRVIVYRGCPLSDFSLGLVPVDHPDLPLTGRVTSSCANGSVTVPIGSSQQFFAARFPTRGLAPGDYIAVVRFTVGGEARTPVTIRP